MSAADDGCVIAATRPNAREKNGRTRRRSSATNHPRLDPPTTLRLYSATGEATSSSGRSRELRRWVDWRLNAGLLTPQMTRGGYHGTAATTARVKDARATTVRITWPPSHRALSVSSAGEAVPSDATRRRHLGPRWIPHLGFVHGSADRMDELRIDQVTLYSVRCSPQTVCRVEYGTGLCEVCAVEVFGEGLRNARMGVGPFSRRPPQAGQPRCPSEAGRAKAQVRSAPDRQSGIRGHSPERAAAWAPAAGRERCPRSRRGHTRGSVHCVVAVSRNEPTR
jgi:hypothetical protein